MRRIRINPSFIPAGQSGKVESDLQKVCSHRICKSIAKRITQVSFHGNIRAEFSCAETLQRWQLEAWRHHKRNAIFTRNLRRIEENEFVSDSRGQSRTVEGWTSFEQRAENFTPAKLGNYGLQIDPAIFRFRPHDFNASLLQL